MSKISVLTNGFIKENPVFILLLGLCPALGVTTTAINGLGMGMATLFVLVMVNVFVSMLKNFIPSSVRIPVFIVLIASFVTMVDLVMNAYTPALHEQLGLFIPLIVCNCVVLGRAEAFASKNKVGPALMDGLGMGLGFTFALVLLGAVRELLGSGALFGFSFLPPGTDGILVFILAPGAFLGLGYLVAIMNVLKK
jgi:Na+-translocating ferredoxin:NAD+ oxidoreductase subunit E